MLTVTVRSMADNEDDSMSENSRIGSVSLPMTLFSIENMGSHCKTWITLFDHPEDDEYDGDLRYDDEEAPRVLFSFSLEAENGSP